VVFSSTGDINRAAVPVASQAKIGLAWRVDNGRKLLDSAVSGATVLAQGLFAALFPSDCRLCGAPLENISRLPVCVSCLGAMHPISGETCEICGERLPGLATLVRPTCSSCQETVPSFTKAVAYGSYDGELRELIHLLKYERVLPAARVLGGMLAEAIEKLNIEGPVLVVSVPLHRSKRRQRGINQTDLIVRAALKKLGRSQFVLARDLLARRRPTVSQIGLTRAQRAENIHGAFQVLHLNRVQGRNILLVDDVLTTGTTGSECARVLRKAGATKVWVATVTRTLKNAGANIDFGPELEPVAEAS
jgi:ComF family protein